MYWNELSDEQKEAADFFGYNENLWNQTEEEESFDGATAAKVSSDYVTHVKCDWQMGQFSIRFGR